MVFDAVVRFGCVQGLRLLFHRVRRGGQRVDQIYAGDREEDQQKGAYYVFLHFTTCLS